MKKKLILPDYTKSNINITATLAEFLGAPNKNATLPLLKAELAKNYKNVVYMIFDGMGIYPLEKTLPQNNLLRTNIKQTLVSTFPSATATATTSLRTNLLPLEHGWLGGLLYFKDLDKTVQTLRSLDYITKQPVDISHEPLEPRDSFFFKGHSDYCINTVLPPYVEIEKQKNNFVFPEDEYRQGITKIQQICKRKEKQFVYFYYHNPDRIMHRFGVKSKESKQLISEISSSVEWLYKNTKNTLIIITADHGHIDLKGWIPLYKDKQIMDMLDAPLYMDDAAITFKVKRGQKTKFAQIFKQKYGKYLELFKTSDLIKQGFFGNRGDKGAILGEFIACSNYEHKQVLLNEKVHKNKGGHSSLTEEMEVPLIMLTN